MRGASWLARLRYRDTQSLRSASYHARPQARTPSRRPALARVSGSSASGSDSVRRGSHRTRATRSSVSCHTDSVSIRRPLAAAKRSGRACLPANAVRCAVIGALVLGACNQGESQILSPAESPFVPGTGTGTAGSSNNGGSDGGVAGASAGSGGSAGTGGGSGGSAGTGGGSGGVPEAGSAGNNSIPEASAGSGNTEGDGSVFDEAGTLPDGEAQDGEPEPGLCDLVQITSICTVHCEALLSSSSCSSQVADLADCECDCELNLRTPCSSFFDDFVLCAWGGSHDYECNDGGDRSQLPTLAGTPCNDSPGYWREQAQNCIAANSPADCGTVRDTCTIFCAAAAPTDCGEIPQNQGDCECLCKEGYSDGCGAELDTFVACAGNSAVFECSPTDFVQLSAGQSDCEAAWTAFDSCL